MKAKASGPSLLLIGLGPAGATALDVAATLGYQDFFMVDPNEFVLPDPAGVYHWRQYGLADVIAAKDWIDSRYGPDHKLSVHGYVGKAGETFSGQWVVAIVSHGDNEATAELYRLEALRTRWWIDVRVDAHTATVLTVDRHVTSVDYELYLRDPARATAPGPLSVRFASAFVGQTLSDIGGDKPTVFLQSYDTRSRVFTSQ